MGVLPHCVVYHSSAWKWESIVKRVVSICVLLSFVALIAAGCGSSASTYHGPPPATTSPSETVNITSSGFNPQELRVNAGQAVTFTNVTGSPATVCLGTEGTCAGSTFGPAALSGNGIQLVHDEQLPVVFKTPGTYHVTSPGNTNRSMTIIVQAA